MQIFLWIVLLIVISIAIFAVQNSDAPAVVIKFLFWPYKTSLVYAILGSIGLGVLITLLFWIPRAIRASIRKRNTNQELPPT
jgi:uncharacterized integral membrane protein